MRFKMTVLVLLFAACSGSTRDPAQSVARLPAGMENRYDLTTEETFTTAFKTQIAPYVASDRAQPVNFVSRHGGVAINARKFTPEDPARDNGAAIVISSGRTEGLIIYPELIYDLQRQGYTVYIHDHRGQGASTRLIKTDGQRSHVDEFTYYVDDLKTFVDREVKPHHKRRFLLAHSMGGGIASLYVEQFKDDFAALALVTPMNRPIFLRDGLTTSVAWLNRWIPGWADKHYGVGQEGYAPRDFAQNDLTHSRVRYLKTHAIYRDNPSNKLGGVTHRWIRQAYNAARQTIDGADEIEIPVLLLQASEDTAVAAAAQDEFCAKVNRSGKGSCTEFVVDKSFHALFNEADTFRIPALTTVLDFFAHPPATSQAARVWQPGSGSGALLVSR
jgi:lysophospholipase